MTYDIAIIGGGPAGVAAGVYAARKKLRTLFLTDNFGGQSVVSGEIQNWIGTVAISGDQLAKDLKNHLEAYAADTIDIRKGERADNISRTDDGFSIKTAKGEYLSKTVLIATGSSRRKLTVPGADAFENKGVTYCASCDGPMFTDMDVTVIGGGNAAFETAAQLLAYAKSVTLLDIADKFRADPVTVEKTLANPKMKAIQNAELIEVKGEKFVRSIAYKDKVTGNISELPVQGIFVEIGHLPATGFASGLVEMNKMKQIAVDPRTQRTSAEGIWAAGDCTDGLYHQNNIAVGDAVKALEDIYMYLHKNSS